MRKNAFTFAGVVLMVFIDASHLLDDGNTENVYALADQHTRAFDAVGVYIGADGRERARVIRDGEAPINYVAIGYAAHVCIEGGILNVIKELRRTD